MAAALKWLDPVLAWLPLEYVALDERPSIPILRDGWGLWSSFDLRCL